MLPKLSDPLVGAALVAGLFALTKAVVDGIVQMICTWMQNRSKKPSTSKKPKKRRRWLRGRPRSPPR